MSTARRLLCGIVSFGLSLPGAGSISAAEHEHLLFRTIRRGDVELLTSLLRQGTPVNLRAADKTTALMVAALHGNARSVELLLDHGADPNASNDIGVTALLWAAGNIEKVRLLLDKGAKVDVRSDLGNTPLIVAAAHPNSASTVDLLLSHGAVADAKNKRGTTPLRAAMTAGDVATVKRLLAEEAVASATEEISKGLAIAAGRGDGGIVELLLGHGADPNAEASNGRGALNAALLAQKPEIARLLIEKGAGLDQRVNPGKVPSIVLAAYTEVGDASIARLMIDKGIGLDAANEYDETALTWARHRGYRSLIDLLVEAGASEEAGAFESKEIPEREIDLNSGNRKQLLAEAIEKSLALLQHSSDVFLDNRESCVSCHHQNLPSIALGWARDRGFSVDEKSIARMNERQIQSWKPRIDRAYQMDRPVPVAPRFIGYGLLGFAAVGYAPDEVTDAMAWYLAAIQQPDGHWTPGMLRPPMGGAEIVATVLALRSLQLYPLEGRADELAERVARAAEWLRAATPRIHQERVYKLLGLGWAGVPAEELQDALTQLLDEQREDGGWAQLPGIGSDAWATGQTLVALHIAGALPTTHPDYERGMEFLLRTRFDDGSWYVKNRTWPFQSYFDSEFPYDRDQWISAPATAWATMALTLAVEPKDDVEPNE